MLHQAQTITDDVTFFNMGLLKARDAAAAESIFLETAGFRQHCTLIVVHAGIVLESYKTRNRYCLYRTSAVTIY